MNTLSLTGITVSVKTLDTVPVTLLELGTGAGTLTFGASGVAGSLTASITTAPAGLGLTGALTVEVDTATGRLVVTGDGLALTVGGHTITADLVVSRSLDDAGAVRLSVAISNASLTFPGVSLTHGSGTFVTSSSGYAGSLAGTVAVTVPGVSVSGTLGLSVNSATSTVSFTGTDLAIDILGQRLSGDLTVTSASSSTTITVANADLDFGGGLLTVSDGAATVVLTGGSLTSLTLSGSAALHVPGLSLTATGVAVTASTTALTVTIAGATLTAGGLALHAGLTFTSSTDAAGARTLSIAIASASGTNLLELADIVTIVGGTGTVLSDASGTSGSLTLSGITFDAGLSFAATSVSISFAGDSASVSVIGGHLVVAGNDLGGNFAFERSGTTTRIAFTDVTVTAGGADIITDVEGGFVVSPAGATGFAGYLTGTLEVGGGGVSAGGTALVRVNTTGGPVNESIEVGGRTVAVTFADGATPWEISVSGLTLQLGDFVTIEGAISWRTTMVGCGDGCTPVSASVFAGQGLRIFIGRGPAFAANGGLNPLATGVLLTDGTIGLVQIGNTYAVTASGTVGLVGIDGVTLGGTAAVRFNDTGVSVQTTVAIGDSTAPPVVVSFLTDADVASFSLTGATISVLGQTLTADVAVDKAANGDIVLAFANAGLSLGGAATLTQGSGMFVLGTAGLAGRLSGTLALNAPGISFGAGLSVAINTTGAAVARSITFGSTTAYLALESGPYLRLDGTGITLTVLGQSITADVSVERTTASDGSTVTVIGLERVGLSFGTSNGYGVTLTGGSGALVLATGGVAGRISGQVGLTLPAGVSASGSLSLALNTTTAAVTRTVTVGRQHPDAGPARRSLLALRCERARAHRPRSEPERRLRLREGHFRLRRDARPDRRRERRPLHRRRTDREQRNRAGAHHARRARRPDLRNGRARGTGRVDPGQPHRRAEHHRRRGRRDLHRGERADQPRPCRTARSSRSAGPASRSRCSARRSAATSPSPATPTRRAVPSPTSARRTSSS